MKELSTRNSAFLSSRVRLVTSVVAIVAASGLAACAAGSADTPAKQDSEEAPASQVAAITGMEGEDPGFATTPKGDIAQQQAALTSGAPAGPVLLGEAERELATNNPSTSYYSHTTYVDETNGTRRVDCSGFLDYSLRRVLPTALVQVPTTHVRPIASDFVHYFQSLPIVRPTSPTPVWTRVATVNDLRGGDVIAWLKPASVTTTSSGHVMIVRGAPTAGRPGEILVPVIDSAMSGHTSDTRTTNTGIGAGVIGLVVDGAGQPQAYYWRGGASTTAFATTIALGRID
jgi:hypothetical protein